MLLDLSDILVRGAAKATVLFLVFLALGGIVVMATRAKRRD